MTSLRIERFMGMAPRISDRLLPDTGAAYAVNARLMSGELRGVRTPQRIHAFSSGVVRNARRFYKDNGTAVWMGLSAADSDIVKGPLTNDSYDRYYWTGDQAYVAYNSINNIEAGTPGPYRLGTPAPTTAPTVGHTGGSGANETRVYCYTFVNDWGEESQPSPVTTYTAPNDATSWDISGMDTTASDMTNRINVGGSYANWRKKIYRTVVGQSSVEYFLVDDTVLMTSATYTDTTPNTTVVQQGVLQSYTWDVPSDNLKGLVVHPGGFLVAFEDDTLYCSVPYRPHAWPSIYALPLEHRIVGLAIYNNMITVLTDGAPYFVAGTRPESLTPIKSDAAEPCLSKASIASTLQGVLYASPNGLVLFNERGPTITTQSVMTIEEWDAYSPSTMVGTQYGMQYIARTSTSKGIKYSPAEPFGIFSELDFDKPVDNIITDYKTGQAWLIQNNSVYQWEPTSGLPQYYTWRSKVYDFTRPINFGAYYIKMGNVSYEQSADQLTVIQNYNNARIVEEPLNPLNYTVIGGRRYGTDNTYTVAPTVGGTAVAGYVDLSGYTGAPDIEPPTTGTIPQNKYPLGGSPLYNIDQETTYEIRVTLNVYTKGRLRYSKEVIPNKLQRLPAGFKADLWQFELVGNDDVYSFAVAEVPKELMNV